MITPSISIIIPTRNSSKMLTQCLDYLQRQTYRNKEIIIVDGMSSDDTRTIAKKYKVKIIDNEDVLAEPGVNLGMKKATGDLLMILAVDNFLIDPNSLNKLARIFENSSVYAAFPKHVSDEKDTIYTKYINTFTDPFNHFVYGDAANARTFYKVYSTRKHTELYDIYDYSSRPEKPLIAFAQGFTIRGGYTRKSDHAFDDLVPVIQLLSEKKDIAYAYSIPLLHRTIRNRDHFIRKQRWATRNALEKKNYGIAKRIDELSFLQQLRIKAWPIYALSFVFPCLFSLYKLSTEREKMWFFHPYLCFLSVYASLTELVIYTINNKSKRVSRL